MKPRVFLIEPTDHDVTIAEEWGELSPLYYPGEPRPSKWSPDFVQQVLQRLEERDYRPEHDRLLIAGQTMQLVLIVSAITAMHPNTSVRALFYSTRRGRYEERFVGASYFTSASTHLGDDE